MRAIYHPELLELEEELLDELLLLAELELLDGLEALDALLLDVLMLDAELRDNSILLLLLLDADEGDRLEDEELDADDALLCDSTTLDELLLLDTELADEAELADRLLFDEDELDELEFSPPIVLRKQCK